MTGYLKDSQYPKYDTQFIVNSYHIAEHIHKIIIKDKNLRRCWPYKFDYSLFNFMVFILDEEYNIVSPEYNSIYNDLYDMTVSQDNLPTYEQFITIIGKLLLLFKNKKEV